MIADGRSQIADSESHTTQSTEPSAIGHQPSAINIVAFCCHYCAYAAADLAGSLRIQHPASVRVVKIPCSGRLDVQLALDAFEHGTDGVMVAGCLEGDCHYQQGNFSARRRVNRVKTLLQEIGLEPDRVRMFNMSSAMGKKWAEAVTEMDEAVRQLGPSPLRKSSG